MSRYAAHILALVLLAAVACATPAQPTRLPEPLPSALVTVAAPTSAPTQAAAATVVFAAPNPSTLLTPELLSSDGKSGDRIAQSLNEWARNDSGLRAQLGSRADDIFSLVDQAEAAAVQDMIQQLQAGTKPKGSPAPLMPPGTGPGAPAESTSLFSTFALLVMMPQMVRTPTVAQTGPSVSESDESIGENARAHTKMQFQITGSTMEVQIDISIRAEKDGVVYEEQVGGRITINLCPDAQGIVPLDLSLQGSGSSGGVSYQQKLTDHATGHVDDEGNLTSIDEQTQMDMSIQPGKGGAGNNQYAQVTQQFTWSGIGHGQPVSVTGVKSAVPRSSSQVTEEFIRTLQNSSMTAGIFAELSVLSDAENKWQNGFCVAVTVPNSASGKIVPVSSETPFTASVQHKFEGKELAVPVIATLASGAVSVTPPGVKVMAPATFRYKAPDKGNETATVELVSRSRRGIGKLSITFRTEEPLAFALEFNMQMEYIFYFEGGAAGRVTLNRDVRALILLSPEGKPDADGTQTWSGKAALDTHDTYDNAAECALSSMIQAPGHIEAKAQVRVEDHQGTRAISPVEILVGIPGLDERSTVSLICPIIGALPMDTPFTRIYV